MIIASEFAPSPALAPFVRSYAFREFHTHGLEVIRPWYACHEPNICFFFKDLPAMLKDPTTGGILKKGRTCDLVGISTTYNGVMSFNGDYAFLQIIFQPHGLHALFNISMTETRDKIVWSGDVFDSQIKFLHEQLYDAENGAAMATLADAWLMQYFRKKASLSHKNRITASANLVTQCDGAININQLAEYACMSPRNFERIFTSEIGMSPKQLCCITRFNKALELKLKYPAMTWTSIAHQSGYFDQMHLIKDFKRFCGEAPASFVKDAPLLEQKYLSRVGQ